MTFIKGMLIVLLNYSFNILQLADSEPMRRAAKFTAFWYLRAKQEGWRLQYVSYIRVHGVASHVYSVQKLVSL